MNKLLISLFLILFNSTVFANDIETEDCDSIVGELPSFCEEPSEIDDSEEEMAAICNDPNNQVNGTMPAFCDEPTPEMEEEIEENPSCAMMICLSTPTLKNSGACLMAQKEFFKIKVKVLGVPDVNATILKRTKKLKECDGADIIDVTKIIAMYGALM